MATVDASIPLQVRQPEDYNTQLMKSIQTGEAMQQMQGQRALREAFQGADTSTPEGQQALIQKVGAADPKAAMTLQQNFLKQRETESTIQKNKATTNKANWEVGAKAMEVISNTGSSVMMTYADLLHKGVPEQQARAIVSQAIPQIKAHLKSMRDPQGNPMFNAEQIDQVPDQFDPNAMMATVTDAKARQEYYTQQHQNETFEQQKKHQGVEERQGAARIGIEAGNAAEHRRHDVVEEGQGAQRVQIERERLAGDPNTIDANAKLIGEGKLAPPTGAALRNPVMARTMARVQELYPNYDAKKYQTEQTGEKAFTSGKQGNTIRSLNVATDHLDALDGMGKALKNGDMRLFNSLAQKYATETGSAAPTNFDAAKKIVADEVVKAIVGSGGGVADREEAAKAFDKASSPEQLSGAIATAKRLMRGQLNGLKKQYKASTGKDDFDERFLSGEAKGVEGGGAKSGGSAGGGTIHWNDLK